MRADLGAALLHNPKVLYLDEPTIGLDLVVKDNIRKAIKEINEKYHTTVILTTHDIGDIEELCSRIIIIDEGKKIYDGTLENLKDTYGKRRKVSMEVRKPEVLQELSLAEQMNKMGTNTIRRDGDSESNFACSITEADYEAVLDVESKTYTVSFDKHKMQVPQILSAVMELTEVTDIKLQETELAEIVKEIYNKCSAEKDVNIQKEEHEGENTITENGGN